MSQKPFLRKYGVEATFNFDLYEVDGVDFRVDAVHAAGDTKLMKDEGAETNTDNAFTDEGQGYSIVLTATEMEFARGKIYVVDQGAKAWLDTSVEIETYGHASAQHAADLDTALATEAKQDTIDTVVDAVKSKTDNLPTDPADASVIAGVLATIAGYIDTEVAAIKAKTDNIPASPAPASEYDTEMARITANVATEAKQDIIDTAVDSVLEDTGELQTDWKNGGRLDNLLDTAAAGGGDATQAKQDIITTHLTELKGAGFVEADDSNEAIRNRGDAAWTTGGAGSGSSQQEIVLTEAGSGTFIAQAFVWITSDEAGAVFVASDYTDNVGSANFLLDDADYYVWCQKLGWNFSFPEELTVSGNGSEAYTGTTVSVQEGKIAICNEALLILSANTINDFTDTTKEATLCEQHFVNALKEALRDHEWSFAIKRSAELAQLSASPEWGFEYQYQLPSDCLRVLETSEDPDLDYEIEGEALLCDLDGDLFIRYVYYMTDTSKFDATFRRMFVIYLASKMAYAITSKRSKEEELLGIYSAMLENAKTRTSKEGTRKDRDEATSRRYSFLRRGH